jgi:phage terminase large subunit GpA-like protein
MVEPMNMLASRRHEAVCFVGPARTGKTMGLLDGWLTYAVTCDPGDMLIVQMSQDKARDYSKTRVDRAIRNSPDLRAKMSNRGNDDNTHDKLFSHGMWLKIGWPSASQLSSSDYRYVGITDYDRIQDNIDGEGSGFGLGAKRTQTFLSRGMCMVESSPGREITDPHWQPSSPHEAPPTNGVLGIYNRSDRRRWYWPCSECGDYFQAAPGLSLFTLLPAYDDLMEIARREDLKSFAEHHAKITCPHCGSIIEHAAKNQMNQRGLWVGDGQRIEDGQVVGQIMRSNIAGYWMGGVSAAYQKWDSIVLRYMQGLREYALTGAEETLKTTINTDQGCPYLPRHLAESAGEGDVSSRTEQLERYFVPDAARLLLASVDVQGGKNGRFVVQVHAIGEGLEQWPVDRFDIAYTDRNGAPARVNPGNNAEDWDLLFDKVVNASYRTSNGKKMLVHMTAIDSGGEGDTTNQAYQFLRRASKLGCASKIMLIKGASTKQAPIKKSCGKDSNGREMKEIPIWLINTDHFKDIVSSILRKTAHGPLYMHLPNWLNADFFDELKAEVKNAKGKWEKIRQRNESLDLCVYILAICWRLNLNSEKFSWHSPPAWAAPLDANSNVMTRELAASGRSLAENKPKKPKRNSTLL